MLTVADAALVKRDPALPGLALILDPEAFTERLQARVPELDWQPAHSRYVRYKPGVNCLAAYDYPVRLPDGTHEILSLYAKAFHHEDTGKLQKWRTYPSVPDAVGLDRRVWETEAVMVATASNDAKVKGLPYLTQLKAHPKRLDKLFRHYNELKSGSLHGLRYKPERRYVAQWKVQGQPRAVLKAYAESGYLQAHKNAVGFISQGELQVPKILGYANRRRVLSMEWLSGQVLSHQLPQLLEQGDAIARVGVALAQLHQQQPPSLETLPSQSQEQSIWAIAQWLGQICPSHKALALHLAQQLTTQLRVFAPVPHCAIHGDFYAEQVIWTDSRIGIIDLDCATLGDPATDLGNFLAHLERQVLFGTLSFEHLKGIRRHFLTGYIDTVNYSIVDRLTIYVAMGLFRLTPEPFRYRFPQWPEATLHLLERVYALLQTPDVVLNIVS